MMKRQRGYCERFLFEWETERGGVNSIFLFFFAFLVFSMHMRVAQDSESTYVFLDYILLYRIMSMNDYG